MKKSLTERLDKKREAWVSRTSVLLDIEPNEVGQLLSIKRRQSLRLNPLKGAGSETIRKLQDIGWMGRQYAWMSEGYTIDSPIEIVRDSSLVAEGEVLIQNAASWLPVLALNPQTGEHILDVCAAPGGKTSHIAAITGNQAHVWANDSSKDRLLKMRTNLDRLGVAIERYTLYDAQRLVRHLGGEQFDKILVDAPCSGEGLRNIGSDKDVLGWSVAHIKRLQQEQKRIVGQAWQLLRPGGTLVYSTCTMAPEENEAVIDYLLRSRTDASIVPLNFQLPNQVSVVYKWNGRTFTSALEGAVRLKPSEYIEAFFVCKLQKSASLE